MMHLVVFLLVVGVLTVLLATLTALSHASPLEELAVLVCWIMAVASAWLFAWQGKDIS